VQHFVEKDIGLLCCAGLKIVDVGGHCRDEAPAAAAGATMTSSQCDPDVKVDHQEEHEDADNHAHSADDATPTETARGK